MMKRKHFKTIACLTLLILLFVLSAGCSQPERELSGRDQENENAERISLNLRLAHFWPATHPAETILVQGWADLVDEVTDGQITITSYPGETLLTSAEIYDGVCTGIADIGLSCFSYTRGRFPLLEVFELPGIVYNNSKAASKVAWEGIKELNPAEVQDTKLLMVLTTGPGDLFTKTPVKTLEDLKDLEIRATGLSAKTLEMLGATPVAMPQAEAYEALSKGVVQGNLAPLEVLQGWRHAEVIDYITLTPFLYNTLFFVTMNLDVWNSIPPHLQEAITEATEKFFDEKAIGLWDMQNESGLEFAVNECNCEIIELTDEEQAKWIDLVKPVQEDFIKEMASKGLDGAGALQLVKELADKYNGLYQGR
ncbi:MAG: TRAP transporter substrate-binding protein [Firmicutes bacterium]|jgi:TRAP-type C4-dicarboxylate transport system substrate-binding protein|nr:TRAP transporter substrate-binding protein [Bacillota bacterium]